MKRDQNRGLISQVHMLVIIGIIVISVFIYFTQNMIALRMVQSQTKSMTLGAVSEVATSMEEFPAHAWLFSYWAEHVDDMDIEYDATFAGNIVTKEKCEKLLARHPDLVLHYCDEEQVEAMDPEDQKLFAEIMYSWLITRLDGIKENYRCKFLYIVMTDTDEGENPYGYQLFLMSAAGPDSVRGTEYEQVYTLGVYVDMDQAAVRNNMREAAMNFVEPGEGSVQVFGETMNTTGRYVDYYSALESGNGKAVLTGVTYYQGEMIDKVRNTALLNTMIGLLYVAILLYLLIHRILVYMLRPMKGVLEEIRVYTESKDSGKAETNLTELLSGKYASAIRENEIGQLAEDFIDLTKEIDAYTVQIETEAAARERFEYELETASQIQAHMLPESHPKFPDHPEFLLSASMIPARDVGGDFYDYFFPDETHLCLVIADVSDKGIPAALFMVQARTLIKSRAMTGEDPGQILTYVNNQLNENNDDGYFVTVWIGIIDLVTGEGIAANAGHEHPVLRRGDGEYELVIYKHNMALGMYDGISYRQHPFRLYPGDRLFVYTDGVPEASNAGNEQFGAGRMLQTLNACKDAEPDKILEQMGSAIDEFTGEAPRFDDTTMICLWYKGMPEDAPADAEDAVKSAPGDAPAE